MTTFYLPAATQLTVTADSISTGVLVRIENGVPTDVVDIAASTAPTFGPFNSPPTYDLLNSKGTLVRTQAPLSVIEGVTSSAAELNKLDGVTSTTAELNVVDNTPADVTVAYTTGTSTDNIITTFTVKDAAGVVITAAFALDVWISDSANGEVLTSTAASGVLTLTTGVQLEEVTAKKHIRILTDENGVLVTDLVDSANTAGEHFCCKNPITGATIVGPATVATDYEGGV